MGKEAYPLNCRTLLRCNVYDMSPWWDRLTIVTLCTAEEIKQCVRVGGQSLS
jgi:hypothetical protein